MNETEKKAALAGLALAFVSVFIPLFHFVFSIMALKTIAIVQNKALIGYVKATIIMSYITITLSIIEFLYWLYVLFIR